MKKSLAVLLIAVLAASVSFAAAPTQPAARGRGRGPALPATLEASMSSMNRSLTAIKAEVTDASKLPQTLKDIATLQRDIAISKTFTPPSMNALTGDKKTEAVESYRTMMVGLMKAALDLEDAVASKKPDEVKKLITQLEEIEKQGHTEFAPNMK